jgi:uncharacterized repeat protein (TIGR03803 family)
MFCQENGLCGSSAKGSFVRPATFPPLRLRALAPVEPGWQLRRRAAPLLTARVTPQRPSLDRSDLVSTKPLYPLFLAMALFPLVLCSAYAQTAQTDQHAQPQNVAVSDTGEQQFPAGQASDPYLIVQPNIFSYPNNARRPITKLIEAIDGDMWGTTEGGGANDMGAIVRLTPPRGPFEIWHLTVVYSFCESCGKSPNSLIQGGDGYIYGTTRAGGSYGKGVIFRISLGGEYTILHNFGEIPDDGAQPTGQLAVGIDLRYYGTTKLGGTYNRGTGFRINSAGNYQKFYDFGEGNSGAAPGALVQGNSSWFYGTTSEGGTYGKGTVYLTAGIPGPQYENLTLYSFCSVGGDDCTDGAVPTSDALVQGADGSLYGTTTTGGANGTLYSGTVYKISLTGTQTVLHSFGPLQAASVPGAGLLLATDGNFYGTTTTIRRAYDGALREDGSVFQITPGGGYTRLYSFPCNSAIIPCPNWGYGAPSGLMQTSNGLLYGNLEHGGANYSGDLYDIWGFAYLPPPVELTLSETTVAPGTPVTLGWRVRNAFSYSSRMCSAFVQNNVPGAGTWTGKKFGPLTGSDYIGSATITPSAAGVYTYVLSCGGTQAGFITLTVN